MMDGGGWKPNGEISPNCPRCGSSNTKFCYYNNYSLTQPRYFCKGCRRYWTKGGSLRNIPIGGGCRKNRRGNSLRLSSSRSKSCPNIDSSAVHTYSSGINSDGPHIDLALVYANFLNPQPDSKSINPNSSSFQELEGEFDPYFDFTNTQLQIPDSAIEGEAPNLGQIENEQFMFYGALGTGMDHSILLAQNKEQCSREEQGSLIKNGLPPLPGEDGGSIWQPETQDPNSLLFGNWSPFDLTCDDHAFSST